ncbi:MAG: hypothetical protein HWN81_00540 [Candidatus Lokiarchaeota archaeon]|nr:hypothetical protein [Candidatus Lokiarchaeota archaeon]
MLIRETIVRRIRLMREVTQAQLKAIENGTLIKHKHIIKDKKVLLKFLKETEKFVPLFKGE